MKKISLFLATAALGFAGVAQAKTINAKVLKKNRDATRVIVAAQDTRGIKKGDFIAFGDNCELEVVNRSDSRLVLDAALCEERDSLTVGKTVELVNENAIEKTSSTFDNDRGSSLNSTRTERSQFERPAVYTGKIAQGFRVSLAFPDLDAKFSGDASGSADANADPQIGIGYANINGGSVGFIGNLNRTSIGDDGDVDATRLEASATMGLAPQAYAFGGLNLNKLSGVEGASNIDMGIGFQVGGGFQATENLGFELKLVETKNSEDGTTLKLKGMEIGVVGTF